METQKKILAITLVVLIIANGYVWTRETTREAIGGLFSNATEEAEKAVAKLPEPAAPKREAYHFFYIDASDADHCRIPLADSLSDWLKNSPDQLATLVYVSRGEDPLLGKGAESWQEVLKAIAGDINPEPPIAVYDIERILQYQDSSEVHDKADVSLLSFVFSESLHNLSGAEIVEEISEKFIENNSLKRIRIYITGELPDQNRIDMMPEIEYVFFPKLKAS